LIEVHYKFKPISYSIIQQSKAVLTGGLFNISFTTPA